MERELQTQFDAVEDAFQELIDSITTYNPSVKATEELLSADDNLSAGLDKLASHQRNYSRLCQLRQTADQLDSDIKQTISRLAQARKELQSTPWTEFPKQSRRVPMEELLAHARRISKFSVPANYRGPPEEQQEASHTPAAGGGDVTMANGTANSPTAEPSGGAETPAESRKEPGASQVGRGAMWDTLPENTRAWLDQMKNAEFLPWPSHELIRNGALGDVQGQIERGEDPWTRLTPAQQEELSRQRKEDEQNEADRDKREREERESGKTAGAREPTAGGKISQPTGPRLTGFGMFADDEDE